MTEHQPQFPQPLELPIDERESPLSLRAQLVRFVITGGLSAIVDFGLLVILMHGWFGHDGLGHTPAKALSFIAGTTTAYLINRRWTFRAEPSKRRFLGVVVLYAVTFALQVGLFSLLFEAMTGKAWTVSWCRWLPSSSPRAWPRRSTSSSRGLSSSNCIDKGDDPLEPPPRARRIGARSTRETSLT